MDTIAETGRSLLEHPQAQVRLADTKVTLAHVQGCRRRLGQFLERYVPRFYRKEQGHNARIVVEGLLRGLERKTAEPIAREHGVPRKPIQFFVGSGKWDDEAVRAELPRDTLIDEAGLARIFGRCSKSIKRAVQRGELPRPVRMFGAPMWTAGAVLDHVNKRLETAKREAERLERRISELSA